MMSPLTHLTRARFFAELARSHQGQPGESELLVAAIYAARAAYENLETAVETGRIKITRDSLRDLFLGRVRYFKLVEYIRLQDFHRRPILFREGLMFYHGPTTLKVTQRGSTAAMKIAPDGEKEKLERRNAHISENRPLTISGFSISDPASDQMVDIRLAIGDHVEDAEALIKSEGFEGA